MAGNTANISIRAAKETIASLPEAERLAIRYTAAFKKDGKPPARTGTHSGLFDQWEGCP